jgi:hypothetical protein
MTAGSSRTAEPVDLTGQLSNPRQPLSYLSDQDFPEDTPAPSTPGTTTPGTGTPQKRLRPDEARQLLAAYDAGATGRELAARFGIHPTTVTAHLTATAPAPAHEAYAPTPSPKLPTSTTRDGRPPGSASATA